MVVIEKYYWKDKEIYFHTWAEWSPHFAPHFLSSGCFPYFEIFFCTLAKIPTFPLWLRLERCQFDCTWGAQLFKKTCSCSVIAFKYCTWRPPSTTGMSPTSLRTPAPWYLSWQLIVYWPTWAYPVSPYSCCVVLSHSWARVLSWFLLLVLSLMNLKRCSKIHTMTRFTYGWDGSAISTSSIIKSKSTDVAVISTLQWVILAFTSWRRKITAIEIYGCLLCMIARRYRSLMLTSWVFLDLRADVSCC